MTAKELIDHLRACGPQDLNVVFHYLADRVHESRLEGGQRLLDSTDFTIWLRELGNAWREAEHHGFLPVHNTCPRCGHIHQGDAECGEDIGGGRICRCELPVPA